MNLEQHTWWRWMGIDDVRMLDLIGQFLNHLNDQDGDLLEVTQGIAKGSSLSPLLGALYLQALDTALENHAKRMGWFICGLWTTGYYSVKPGGNCGLG